MKQSHDYEFHTITSEVLYKKKTQYFRARQHDPEFIASICPTAIHPLKTPLSISVNPRPVHSL